MIIDSIVAKFHDKRGWLVVGWIGLGDGKEDKLIAVVVKFEQIDCDTISQW